jgi:hypothetical protein
MREGGRKIRQPPSRSRIQTIALRHLLWRRCHTPEWQRRKLHANCCQQCPCNVDPCVHSYNAISMRSAVHCCYRCSRCSFLQRDEVFSHRLAVWFNVEFFKAARPLLHDFSVSIISGYRNSSSMGIVPTPFPNILSSHATIHLLRLLHLIENQIRHGFAMTFG